MFDNLDEIAFKAILTTTNEICFKINELILLTKIIGEMYTFKSYDTIETNNPNENINLPTEFLNSLTPSGLPPHKLNLKIDAWPCYLEI